MTLKNSGILLGLTVALASYVIPAVFFKDNWQNISYACAVSMYVSSLGFTFAYMCKQKNTSLKYILEFTLIQAWYSAFTTPVIYAFGVIYKLMLSPGPLTELNFWGGNVMLMLAWMCAVGWSWMISSWLYDNNKPTIHQDFRVLTRQS